MPSSSARVSSSTVSRRGDGSSVSLPAYEPPYLPLAGESALRIAGLGTNKLKDAVDDAMKLLILAAADLTEANPSGDNAEQNEILKQCELHMRGLLDESHKVDTSKEILEQIGTEEQNAQRQQRNRARLAAADDSEDEDVGYKKVATDEGPWGRYNKQMEMTQEAYQSKSERERYNIKEYHDYRRAVWDAANPGKPAPKPSQLFDADGNVALQAPVAANDEDEDDFEIAQESGIVKCPLTMRYFEEPVTSQKCPHSFEKTAILEMISKAGREHGRPISGAKQNEVACPNAGCSKVLRKEDLLDDPALLRRVQRHREEEERRARQRDEVSDEEDADDNAAASTAIKRERVKKNRRRKAHVLDLGDEEEEEEEEQGDEL